MVKSLSATWRSLWAARRPTALRPLGDQHPLQKSVDLICDSAGKPRVPLYQLGSPQAALRAAGFYAIEPHVSFPEAVWLLKLESRSEQQRVVFASNVDREGSGSFFAPFREYSVRNGLFLIGSEFREHDGEGAPRKDLSQLQRLIDRTWGSFPLIISQHAAYTCELPSWVTTNAEGQAHNSSGAAAQWPDGTQAFALKNEPVPAFLFRAIDVVAAERIIRETDLARRERMTEHVGWPVLLELVGARVIDHDEACGTLYQLGGGLRDIMLVLKVVNRTPEPDGSFKPYFLTAHPELRPLPDLEENPFGSLGQPQALTARNAAASLLGLRGEQMQPELET